MSDTCERLCHSTVQDVGADFMLGRTLRQRDCTLSTKTDLLAVLLMVIV